MKLTNAIRISMAKEMAHDLSPKTDGMFDMLCARAMMLAREQVPAEVLHGFDKYPMYYAKTNAVKMKKKDWKSEQDWYSAAVDIHINVMLPNSGWCIYLEHDAPCAALDDKIEASVEKREELEVKIHKVLMSVNTTKQLEEILPDAVKYLPDQAGGAVVPMAEYDALRKEIELLKEQNKE